MDYLSTMQGKLQSGAKMTSQSIVGLIKRVENLTVSKYVEHYDVKSDSFKKGTARGAKRVDRSYVPDSSEIRVQRSTSVEELKSEALDIQARNNLRYEDKHLDALRDLGYVTYDDGVNVGFLDSSTGEIVPERVVKKKVSKREKEIKEENKKFVEEFSAPDVDDYYDRGKEKFSFNEIQMLREEIISYIFKSTSEKGVIGRIKDDIRDTIVNMTPNELRKFADIMSERGINTLPDNYEELIALDSALIEARMSFEYDDMYDDLDDALYDDGEFGEW